MPVKSKFTKLRKTKYAKKGVIQTLVKKVAKLTKIPLQNMLLKKDTGFFNLQSNVVSTLMNDFSNQSIVFGTGTNDVFPNRVVWKKSELDFILQVNNEYSNVSITMFIVRPKDVLSQAIDSTTGALTLTADDHYITTSGQQVILNKKYFNTLYTKKFYLGNNGVAPGQGAQGGSDLHVIRRIKKTLYPNININNPKGDVRTMAFNQDPSKNIYVLTFCDNISVDLENPIENQLVLNTLQY